MDRYDMTFIARPNARDRFTNLRCTSVAELLHAAGPAGEQLPAAGCWAEPGFSLLPEFWEGALAPAQ
jgi:hypothetical protein